VKNSIQILIFSFFSVLTRRARELDQSSSGSEKSIFESTQVVFDSEPVSSFLKGGRMMGFRKIIVAHVLMALLSVPVQLFAAPPSPPPPIEVENVENGENFEEVEEIDLLEEVEEIDPVEKVEEVEEVEQARSQESDRRDKSSGSGETRQLSATEPPSRIATGLAQSGAGLMAGLGLGLVGYALGGGGGGVQGFDIGGMFLAFVGYGVGSSVSVWAVGESMGWDGSLFATFGGFLASLMLAPLILVGPTIGYQLSADWPTRQGVSAVPGSLALPAAVAMPDVTSISIVSFDF
jgi:hypothetical protein